MFGISPTQYDLQFSIFGIPVRVHPGFWVVAALLGWNQNDPNVLQSVLIWIACVFVSILIHELGHAFSARWFGWPPEIVLYHFGGLATFLPRHGYTTGRSIFISLAGPGAGFLLLGLVVAVGIGLALNGYSIDYDTWYGFAIIQLVWINLFWGILNLLPVLPLDGGQVCREVCTWFSPRGGLDIAIKISIVFAGGVAAFLLYNHLTFGGIMFGMLAFQNFQSLQVNQRGGWM